MIEPHQKASGSWICYLLRTCQIEDEEGKGRREEMIPGCTMPATLSAAPVRDSEALSRVDFWESGVMVSSTSGALCQQMLLHEVKETDHTVGHGLASCVRHNVNVSCSFWAVSER